MIFSFFVLKPVKGIFESRFSKMQKKYFEISLLKLIDKTKLNEIEL